MVHVRYRSFPNFGFNNRLRRYNEPNISLPLPRIWKNRYRYFGYKYTLIPNSGRITYILYMVTGYIKRGRFTCKHHFMHTLKSTINSVYHPIPNIEISLDYVNLSTLLINQIQANIKNIFCSHNLLCCSHFLTDKYSSFISFVLCFTN